MSKEEEIVRFFQDSKETEIKSDLGKLDQAKYPYIHRYLAKIGGKLVKKDADEIKELNTKAREIVESLNLEGKTDQEKAKKIHDYIVDTTEYNQNSLYNGTSGSRHNQGPYGALILGTGVCNSYAEAFQYLANLAGLESIYLVGEADNGTGPQGHAWNKVKIEGDWYNIDTTWDDPIVSCNQDLGDTARYRYFLRADQEMPSHTGKSPVKATRERDFSQELGIEHTLHKFKDVYSIEEIQEEINKDPRGTIRVRLRGELEDLSLQEIIDRIGNSNKGRSQHYQIMGKELTISFN